MKETDESVIEFIDGVKSERKKADVYKLLDIFAGTTGYEAKMWGSSIIGFGSYHYKYATGHEGDAPLVGFSPRKANISLYFAVEDTEREKLLKEFGKYKSGKSCIYINKLDDVNVQILEKLILRSIEFLQERYPQ